MNFILDTHVFLWALAEPEKLSPAARSAIEEPAHHLFVSSISLFEVATKVRVGKLKVPERILNQWEFALSQLGASLTPVLGQDSVRAGLWPVEHRDPFDRILAAQAVNSDRVLISRDSAFAEFSGLQTLW